MLPLPAWIDCAWSGSTTTPAPCSTVVVAVFDDFGLWVFPRSSWNEIVPLLLMIVPAAVPALMVTVNCRDPDAPAATVPMLQVTIDPESVPPPVALTKVVRVGTTSVIDTLVADPVPVLL